MGVPIWILAVSSILSLFGYLAIGFVVTMEVDDYTEGHAQDRFIFFSLCTWLVTVPVWLTLDAWAKRRREEAELNGLQ